MAASMRAGPGRYSMKHNNLGDGAAATLAGSLKNLPVLSWIEYVPVGAQVSTRPDPIGPP